MADALISAIHEMRSSHTPATGPTERYFTFDDAAGPEVAVSIIGDRGTGKTTLLRAVCLRLQQDSSRHIVLPVMRPEMFGMNDTVISIFLASLSREFQDSATSWGRTLETVTRVSRTYARSRTPERALEAAHSPIDYAEDSLSVARSSVSLADELTNLVASIVSSYGEIRQIIVPIDDPDLAPELLPSLIRETRILGSIPGVVPLLCFSATDMQLEMLASRRRRYDWLSNGLLHGQIERELDKTFPHKYRYELRPLSVYDRAAFRPTGKALQLGRLLELLSQAFRDRYDLQLDFSQWLRGSRYLRGLTSPLPSNPRLLVQFWEAVDPDIRTTLSALQLAAGILQKLAAIIERPLVTSLSDNVLSESRIVDVFESGLMTHESDGQLVATLDTASDIYLVVSRSPFGGTSPESGSHVEVTGLERLVADVKVPGEERRSRMSPEALSAYLALQEIALAVSPREEHSRIVVLDEDDWSFLQRVTLDGVSTANITFIPPPVATFSDVCASADLWESLVELRLPSDDLALWARAHLALSRAFLAGRTRLSLRDFEDHAYDSMLDGVIRDYSFVRLLRDARSDAYCTWFESYLPLQWHTSIFPEDRIGKFAARHRKIVVHGGDSGTRVNAAHVAPFEHFDDCISRGFGKSSDSTPMYLAGYYVVAKALGSPLASRIGARTSDWLRYLAGDGAPATTWTETRNPGSFAEQESAHGTALYDAAVDTVRQIDPESGDE